MSDRIKEALSYIDQKSFTSLLTDMIDIPSPVGGESEIAFYLEDRFRKVGLRTRLQEVEPGRHNVFGVLEGSGGGASLMYNGHLDSAYGGDEEGIRDLGPGYQPKSWVDGEWIHGLGAYNMKSGHAAAILAVESLARSKAQFRGDLLIAGVVGETSHAPVGRYQGSRYRGCGVGARFMVANGVGADMVVIPEPTSNRISVASGGYVFFELQTRGNPGATYRRGGSTVDVKPGEDAIKKMLQAIPALESWGEHYCAHTRYKGEPAGNVNIIAIEGGHPFRPTKLPSFCRLYLEVGIMPGQEHRDIIDGVRSCVGELQTLNPTLQVEVNVIQTAHTAEVSPNEYVVRAISSAHQQVWGDPPEVTWDGWYADTAPLTRAGIPAICYGPQGRMRGGGSGYYPKEGEHASAVDLTLGTKVFVHAAADICMQPREAVRANQPTGTVTI
jgi:acetylornithine deacetylase/succinyl-diaminopimelate desuccinylase-like protein